MSERLTHHPEHHRSPEQHHEENREQHEQAARHHEVTYENKHEQAERLASLQREAKARAESLDRVKIERVEKEKNVPRLPIDRAVKEASRRRVMKRVQKQLRPDERAFSKFTHNPTVDAVSRAAEKTVARPSGLFTGGLIALIGSSAYLWIARYYGYEYNYLLFLLLFVVGFAIGVVLELFWHAVRRKKAA